jgi:anti-sigma factor RsiW
MPSCAAIEPLVTSYVDGEIAPQERAAVDEHLQRCSLCRARITAEQAVHDLCLARRAVLGAAAAPETLHARCASLASDLAGAPDATLRVWRDRVRPFALAASLVLIVVGAFVVQMTRSSNRLMAAQLTADHVKCFALNNLLGTHHSGEAVRSSLASGFAWNAQLPAESAETGLELVASRPCLYGEGRVAHIMYRHNGQAMSLFMLPESARDEELIEVLGHEAAIWSVGDRTFVLIARERRSEVERLAGIVRASLR